MLRRTFLKLLAFLPVSAYAKFHPDAPTELSQQALIDWFERTFACQMGAPTMWADAELAGGDRIAPGRIQYVEYDMRTKDTHKGRARLILSMWQTFARKLALYPEIQGTRLYWRLADKIEIRSYVLFEDEWPYEAGDRLVGIYLRVAIPELQRREHVYRTPQPFIAERF